MSTLSDKLVRLHADLEAHHVRHAFGGAIALAYCTGEPRGTIDIDLNVFTPPEEAGLAFASLPREVRTTSEEADIAEREGQVRLFWGDTPIDVFFSHHSFHEAVADRVRVVPFANTRIPVLGCEDLVVFKAVFARTKDWADIEAVAGAGTIDVDAICRRLGELVGTDHASYPRLLEALSVGASRRQP